MAKAKKTRTTRKKVKKQVAHGKAFIHATYNNTVSYTHLTLPTKA